MAGLAAARGEPRAAANNSAVVAPTVHDAANARHGPPWSADVLMAGLAAARDERSAQATKRATDPRDTLSRERLLASRDEPGESASGKTIAASSPTTIHTASPVDIIRSTGGLRPVESSGSSVHGPFELNVGGRVFTTRRSTLTMEAGSMLANLFDKGSMFNAIDRDSAGRLFLDRDGDSFAVVLDYLRRAGRLVGRHSADMLSRVREDAEYFGLAALVAAVDAHTEAAEAERTRMQEAEDAKRLAEAVAAEERQAARDAELRQRKIIEYDHMLWGPLKCSAGTPHDTDANRLTELAERKDALRRYCEDGWRVEKMASGADGTWLELLLARETDQPVDHS
eukprot:COSAG03_NODE_3023_length_2281_cov_1.570119_2_plen_340_part_00